MNDHDPNDLSSLVGMDPVPTQVAMMNPPDRVGMLVVRDGYVQPPPQMSAPLPPLLARLLDSNDDPAAAIIQWGQTRQKMVDMAVATSHPEHWVLNRKEGGPATAVPGKQPIGQAMNLFAISVFPIVRLVSSAYMITAVRPRFCRKSSIGPSWTTVIDRAAMSSAISWYSRNPILAGMLSSGTVR